MGIKQQRTIYEVCQKHNVCTIEDGSCYFIQRTEYSRCNETHSPAKNETDNGTVKEYLKRLVPIFLSSDTDGRVLRLNSFSDIFVPGAKPG